MEGKSFHLTVDTVDHCASSTPQTLIGLGVSNMPDNLKAHIGAEGLMKKLSTTITAHDFDVSRIVVFAKIPGWPGYDFELTDIPKDVEVGVDVIVGAAVVNALRLPSGATLGGWRLTAFTDSTHYLSATYGNAQAFDYQADLDGGQTYAKVPRFFNARVGLADVSVQAQAGSYGMNIHGSSVTTGRVAGGIVVATALIGLTYAAIDTGHLFLDKAEETAGTLSAKFMDNTGGPYLMPVGMWLATS